MIELEFLGELSLSHIDRLILLPNSTIGEYCEQLCFFLVH